MCGIAGIVSWTDQRANDRVAAMTAALAHRGPDDSGVSAHDGVYLGHRRLSIIDLSPAGHQPMANADGSVWITYNGELYGTAETRAWLESRGYEFASRTDTEVLLHLYEEVGVNVFERINGMFAFAIHDRRHGRLLLGRDRLGIKPLYYAVVGGELVFASELKAILAALASVPSLRSDVIGQYLLQGYPSAPDTVYEGILALPPGHYLDIDLAALEHGRVPEPVEYWDAPFTGDDERPVDEVESQFECLLSDAVAIRMVSDVPFGAFLSGGIDSSVVVSLMARASQEPVRTFTVDLPGTDRSERAKAVQVARRYDTLHTEIDAVAGTADDYWPRLEHFDQPFNCPSLLNTWLVSRAAREHVTVALSGDGGDELFGGYTRYFDLVPRGAAPLGRAMMRQASRWLPVDVRGRARVAEFGHDDFMHYFSRRHPFPVEAAESLVGTSLAAWIDRMRATFERHAADIVNRASYFDLKTYLPDHVLAKVDSASMAVSLEVRVPMLDYRIVELAGRLPSRYKTRDGGGKWLLKRIAARLLPDELIEQQKVGFDPPLAEWVFVNELDARLDELGQRSARFRRHLDGQVVDRWIGALRTSSRWRVGQRAGLWAIYQFERWLAGAPTAPFAAASAPRFRRSS